MSGSEPLDPLESDADSRATRDPRDILVESVVSLVSRPEMTDGLIDFVGDVAEALQVDAVGVLVRSPSGDPELLCSTSHRMSELEIYMVGHNEGPCVECLRSGVGVTETGDAIAARWPTVGPVIGKGGFGMVTTIPMLWQDAPVGGLNLFRRRPIELTPDEMALGRSFAAVATLALGQGSTNDRLAGSVVTVLNGRVVIEQAKGILFERQGLEMSAAYEALRSLAADTGRSVTQAARELLTEAQRRT